MCVCVGGGGGAYLKNQYQISILEREAKKLSILPSPRYFVAVLQIVHDPIRSAPPPPPTNSGKQGFKNRKIRGFKMVPAVVLIFN